MRWLLFLSRLAFICNCFFLLAVSLQLVRWFHNQDAESTVIIIGYFMAALVNPVANFCYLALLVLNRKGLHAVPLWLRLANFIFLLIETFYILHLNGK